MEIGNEISQKIRSAIKAKLVDLGAYVDDELPDYIMVMVANKKTKEQMTDDLNLFLGNNTEKFTTWLTSLLDKLNSLSADNSSTVASSEKVQNSVPVPQAPTVSKDTNIKAESGDAKHQTVHLSTSKKNEKSNGEGSNQRKRTSSENKSAAEPAKKRMQAETTAETKYTAVKDVEIEITPSRDELEDVTEELPKRRRLGPLVRTPQPSKGTKPPTKATVSPQAESQHTTLSEPAVTSAKTDVEQTSNHSVTKQLEKVKQPISSRLGPPQTGTKRKTLTSAIGAVVKHPSLEEEDEEYDPHKPFIGNVASVVKVSERKSKVPAAWQADKSILLKAITAAQDSIEKKSKKTAEKAIVHPTVQRPSLSRVNRREVHKRLGDRSSSSRQSNLRSDRLQYRRSPIRIESKSARCEHPVPLRQRSKDADSQKSSSTEEKRRKNERSIQVFQKVREENDDVFDNLKSKISAHKQGLHVSKERKSSVEVEEPTGKDGATSSVGDDCRLIEYDPEEKTKPKYPVPEYKSTLSGQVTLTTLVESGAEESDFTDGEGDDNRIIQKRELEHRDLPRSVGPKFVVTLDGVDPSTLKTDVMSDSDIEMDDDIKTESNIVRVEPRPQIPVQPQIQPVTVNLSQDEDSEYEKSEATSPSKSTERCRFFPGCKNGDACPFFHPKEQCSKFPHCKFGDKCLYIHPVCKFDSACRRPDCIFAHTVKRATSQFPQPVPLVIQPVKVPIFYQGDRPVRPKTVNKHPSEVTCKYFPKCTNMNCPFNHPAPCRFGIACNNKATCRFTHPKLPSKKELTWSSKQKTLSSTKEESSEEVANKP